MNANTERNNLPKFFGAMARLLMLGVYLVACTPAVTTPISSPSPVLLVLDNADSAIGWTGSDAVSVEPADYQEGSGALTSSGFGPDWFKKTFSTPINTDLTEANGIFKLWIYVSDVTRINENLDAQIELSSSGRPDVDEYSWNIRDLNLVNGWNLVSFRFSDAAKI